jgi:hypothetical protein
MRPRLSFVSVIGSTTERVVLLAKQELGWHAPVRASYEKT